LSRDADDDDDVAKTPESVVGALALLDGTKVKFRVPNLARWMSVPGREREFADRNSGHTCAHRPQVLAVQLVNVSSPLQTGR
jgi:hypothetical protein